MGTDVTKVLPKSSHLAVMISPCFHWNSRCFSLLSTIFPIKIPMEGHFFSFFPSKFRLKMQIFRFNQFFRQTLHLAPPQHRHCVQDVRVHGGTRRLCQGEGQGHCMVLWVEKAKQWGPHIHRFEGFGLVQQRRSLDLRKFVSVFLRTVWGTLGEYLGALNPADTKRLRFNQVPLRKPTRIPQEELI